MNNIEFAERLNIIIQYKTGGNKRKFGEMLGWSPQYTQKLTQGQAIGLNPVETIAATFADINIRWLITGEGSMFNVMSNRILTWFKLEKYIPVMTTAERNRIDLSQQYTLDDIARWEHLLETRTSNQNKIAEAIAKQQKNGQKMQSACN